MRFFEVGSEARAVIAIGQQATGVIAIGQIATGVIAIGQLSQGFIAVGQLARGVIVFGQLGIGVFGGGMVAVCIARSFGLVAIAARASGAVPVTLWPKAPPSDEPVLVPVPLREARPDGSDWVRLSVGASLPRVVLTDPDEGVQVATFPEQARKLRTAAEQGGEALVRVAMETVFEEGAIGLRDAAPSQHRWVAREVRPVPRPRPVPNRALRVVALAVVSAGVIAALYDPLRTVTELLVNG